MTVIGVNLVKISAERSKPLSGKINIENNIAIKDVQNANLAVGKAKESGLRFTFVFTTMYSEGVGKIEFTGELLYLGSEKVIKETLDLWKKDKKVPKEVMGEVLNSSLNKCHLEALVLSNEINLPPPIQLPRIKVAE